jgi:hypothetical protein
LDGPLDQMITAFAKDPRPEDLHLETSVKMKLSLSFSCCSDTSLLCHCGPGSRRNQRCQPSSTLLVMHIEQIIELSPKLTSHIPEKWYPWMGCLEDQSSNLTDGQHFYQETKAFLLAPQQRCIQCSKCQWPVYTAIGIIS